ncbi:hypothetical protein JIN85_00275 [Luteolibacter pohnpeiensis]|uniref:Uncharacterized protein n=1 Tax=Luteolibacter pohnpeiensis TaxID=454153 RepID=A0A934S7K6_9BACT|nr:hypothetical protein [Luteolibacter pohnpeiensis]MBK1880824.1 hypothetical protein [Luteolibacter pohnpeiensis]
MKNNTVTVVKAKRLPDGAEVWVMDDMGLAIKPGQRIAKIGQGYAVDLSDVTGLSGSYLHSIEPCQMPLPAKEKSRIPEAPHK